jgi:hypothetical protein
MGICTTFDQSEFSTDNLKEGRLFFFGILEELTCGWSLCWRRRFERLAHVMQVSK